MDKHKTDAQVTDAIQQAEQLIKEAQYAQALERLQLLLNTCKEQDYYQQQVLVLQVLANASSQQGQIDTALQYAQEALAISQLKLGDKSFLASTYHLLGILAGQAGKYTFQLKQYQQAVQLRESLYEQQTIPALSLIESYIGLADSYGITKDLEQQYQFAQKAHQLALKTVGKEHPIIAESYFIIGTYYTNKSDYDKGLSFFQNALHIWRQRFGENHEHIGWVYNHLGWCCGAKKDYQQALQYHQKSLSVRQKMLREKHPQLAQNYNNLGFCYSKLNQHDQALESYLQALQIQQHNFGTQAHPKTILNYRNLGYIYTQKKVYDKAEEYLNKAIEGAIQIYGKHHQQVAIIYVHSGNCFQSQGKYEQALKNYQAIFHTLIPSYSSTSILGNPSLNDYYFAPHLLLLAFRAKAKTLLDWDKEKYQKEAFQSLQLALQLIDQLRNSYKAEGSSLHLGKETHAIYEATIHLALQIASTAVPSEATTYWNEAFQFAEKSKGVLLLSQLQDAQAKLTAHIPNNLLEQERSLRQELSQLDQALQKAQYQQTDEESQSLLQNQYFQLSLKYDQLIEQFEQKYPAYYQLKYNVNVATITDLQTYLQEQAIASGILSFFVGEKYLFVFAITAQDFQVYQQIKSASLAQQLQQFYQAMEEMEKRVFIQVAYQLYHTLLEPILQNSSFANIEQLTIIPDNELTYLPFEALLAYKTSDKTNYQDLPYLLHEYNINYHYSVSLLLSIHQQAPTNLDNNFLGFAPVYANASDLPSSLLSIPQLPTTRSIEINGEEYAELVYSEQEVNTIKAAFSARKHTAQTYLHAAASLPHFKSQASQYKYILISAHGRYDPEQPELSGIIFSPTPNTLKEEAILHMKDAYLLQLQAELVVLSCCESGLGKLIKGEGMMGMNRGFLYAGAKNVVFTLFKVYDEVSCTLTQYLFQYILEGQTYTQALNEAKRKLLQEEGIDPMCWAGYVLIGN